MTQVLLERNDSPQASTSQQPIVRQPTARRRGHVLRGFLAVLAAAALVVPLAPRALDFLLPDWRNPFAPKVVDRSPAPLVLAMRDLAEYHAASGTFQAVLDIERDTPHVPSLISGERVTFLAVGTVDAVVDFSNLDGEKVTVSADRRAVTISLPAPWLAPATIDHDTSRVLDRDRGLVERVAGVFEESPTGEQELYGLAQTKLDAAAARSDLLSRAEQSTRTMLTGLAGSFGFDQVTVTFSAPEA
jgi:hypothetical protein